MPRFDIPKQIFEHAEVSLALASPSRILRRLLGLNHIQTTIKYSVSAISINSASGRKRLSVEFRCTVPAMWDATCSATGLRHPVSHVVRHVVRQGLKSRWE